MADAQQATESGLVPYFSYRDAATALDWLGQAFGFERVVAYPGEDGRIMHAEMRFGGGRLMIGSGDPPPVANRDAASPNGHGTYVVVADVDAHHAAASAAGAEVVYPPEDTEFGTRRYRALDLEAMNGASAPTGPARRAEGDRAYPRWGGAAARRSRKDDQRPAGLGHRPLQLPLSLLHAG